jgi:CRP-like cAMP-binding protein
VAVSWLSDLVLLPHPVQLNLGGGRGATQAHYEPGEMVFEEGDAADSLYMILAGEVEVRKLFGAEPQVLRTLDLLVLPASDFSALADGLSEFRGEFEAIARTRAESDAARAASESSS